MFTTDILISVLSVLVFLVLGELVPSTMRKESL
jgi:hypothetical protein